MKYIISELHINSVFRLTPKGQRYTLTDTSVSDKGICYYYCSNKNFNKVLFTRNSDLEVFQ